MTVLPLASQVFLDLVQGGELELENGGTSLELENVNEDLQPDTDYWSKSTQDGDGSTTTFDIPFSRHRWSNLIVQVYDSTGHKWDIQEEGTDYELGDGNTIEFLTGAIPASGTDNIEIWRETPRVDPGECLGAMRPNAPTTSLTVPHSVVQEVEDQLTTNHREYYFLDSGATVTAVNLTHGGVPVVSVHETLTEPMLFEKVGMTFLHNDGSAPSDWILKFFIVASSGGTPYEAARMTIDFSPATALVNYATVQSWKDPSSGATKKVAVEPGQMFYFTFAGSAVNLLWGRVNVSNRRRVPYK